MAKKQAGKLSYASSGAGSSAHLATELFLRSADIDVQNVTYSGGAPAVQALITGEVEMAFVDAVTALPLIADKQVTAIGVSSPQRNPLAPNVPTIAESGYPGYECSSDFALLAPAGTPPAIIQKLAAAKAAALQSAGDRREAAQRLDLPRCRHAGGLAAAGRCRKREVGRGHQVPRHHPGIVASPSPANGIKLNPAAPTGGRAQEETKGMSDTVPFRPFVAGTQPPLDHAAYGSTQLRHPTRRAAAAGADRHGNHRPAIHPGALPANRRPDQAGEGRAARRAHHRRRPGDGRGWPPHPQHHGRDLAGQRRRPLRPSARHARRAGSTPTSPARAASSPMPKATTASSPSSRAPIPGATTTMPGGRSISTSRCSAAASRSA